MHQLPSELKDALNALGRPWEIVNGRKHLKIYVDGVFATIWPHGRPKDFGRRTKNTLLHIQRFGQRA